MKRYSVIPVVFVCMLLPVIVNAQGSSPGGVIAKTDTVQPALLHETLRYTITMGDKSVGISEVTVEPERDGRVKAQSGHPWPAPLTSIPSVTLHNKTRIDIKSMLFSYHMTSTVRETWLANRLISAAAETVEDGETTRTSVRRDADMLVVVTNTGERRLTGDIATTSFWNLTRLPGGVLTFLDVESGTDFQARAQFVKETQITVKGNAVPCRLWQLSADTETQLWFDRDDILVRLEYEEQGQRFVHSLDRRTIIQPKEQP